jgi:hypothetical protein
MDFFQYDKVSGNIEIDDAHILIVREFSALLDTKRNITPEDKTGKKRLLAFKELKYIYLFFDWKSVYFSLPEQTRHEEALLDSGLTPEEFNDETFRAACRKYQEIQESNPALQLLKAAQNAVSKVTYYLNNVDLQERDETGKPIFKNKDLIAEIKGSKDLLVALKELENQVKKDIDISSGLRGDIEGGMFD